MPTRWFRHYAGLYSDDKLKEISLITGQEMSRVIAIWCAVLESAAEIDDEGRARIVPAVVAHNLGIKQEDVAAIMDAFARNGRVTFQKRHGNACNENVRIANWSQRQYPSDSSTERVRKWRNKAKGETFPKRSRNVAETAELELDIKKERAGARSDFNGIRKEERWIVETDSRFASLRDRATEEAGKKISAMTHPKTGERGRWFPVSWLPD